MCTYPTEDSFFSYLSLPVVNNVFMKENCIYVYVNVPNVSVTIEKYIFHK